jgi:hypothetical protein
MTSSLIKPDYNLGGSGPQEPGTGLSLGNKVQFSYKKIMFETNRSNYVEEVVENRGKMARTRDHRGETELKL